MKYISTRGLARELNFSQAMIAGMASDGGLYVPKKTPKITAKQLDSFKKMSYPKIAFEVIKPYVSSCIDDTSLNAIIAKAYKNFRVENKVEIKKLVCSNGCCKNNLGKPAKCSNELYVCELFHGPTIAFKDFALQLLGLLFDYVLSKQTKRITIVGATSGDTGSAAIEAFKNLKSVDIFILHPLGKTSDIQRLQMTTVNKKNVRNIAIKGNFDDCQNIVKALFNDEKMRSEVNLSAVNSINWARIMAQIVYYVFSYVQVLKFKDCPELSNPTETQSIFSKNSNCKNSALASNQAPKASSEENQLFSNLRSGGDEKHLKTKEQVNAQNTNFSQKVSFSVPTGNFGNVLAGYYAMQMGIPIESFMISSNLNDILTRFILNNDMTKRPVVETHSPSMDIQVSSNFERLLFEFLNRDAKQLTTLMANFNECGIMDVDNSVWQDIRNLFQAHSSSNAETLCLIEKWFNSTKEIFDPHSITAIEAGSLMKSTSPVICMATAHPAKFPTAIREAFGNLSASNGKAKLSKIDKHLELPEHMRGLDKLSEHYTTLENDYKVVGDFVLKFYNKSYL